MKIIGITFLVLACANVVVNAINADIGATLGWLMAMVYAAGYYADRWHK